MAIFNSLLEVPTLLFWGHFKTRMLQTGPTSPPSSYSLACAFNSCSHLQAGLDQWEWK